MKLKVIRNKLTDKCTLGGLYIDNKWFCYTLEDIIREDGVKVYGETAIPEGTYKVVLSMSNRFGIVMPEVLNVPNFKGIRIHPGNTNEDTHGCLLVGHKISGNTIEKSKDAFKMLMTILEPAFKKGEITIQYINDVTGNNK